MQQRLSDACQLSVQSYAHCSTLHQIVSVCHVQTVHIADMTVSLRS